MKHKVINKPMVEFPAVNYTFDFVEFSQKIAIGGLLVAKTLFISNTWLLSGTDFYACDKASQGRVERFADEGLSGHAIAESVQGVSENSTEQKGYCDWAKLLESSMKVIEIKF